MIFMFLDGLVSLSPLIFFSAHILSLVFLFVPLSLEQSFGRMVRKTHVKYTSFEAQLMFHNN